MLSVCREPLRFCRECFANITELKRFIDEYDIPIQQGHTAGFYGQVVDFMRNLFSGGRKDNNIWLSIPL